MPPDPPSHRDVLVSSSVSEDHEQDALMVPTPDGEAGLSLREKAFYSVGHVLNDLTASVWFTYMLVYLQEVVSLGPKIAGNLILIGQVADAIFNPVIGFLSDRDQMMCLRKYGRRKRWHFLGTLCVIMSFPFLLTSCFGCAVITPRWALITFYVALIIMFQFGWASTQIAHLALIADLSVLDKDRLELNSMRYGWTVISNMVVYGVTWALFGTSASLSEKGTELQPEDGIAFAKLAFIVIIIGLAASIIFYIGTPTPVCDRERDCRRQCVQDASYKVTYRSSLKRWLKDPAFYTIAVLYMCARLTVNLTQVYIPFFVTETLRMDKYVIACYPLLMYIFSFITTVMMKFIANWCTPEMIYLLGSMNVIGASLWMIFLQPHMEVATFGTSILSGIGGAAIMVTSLSMVSDFIGTDRGSSAFVFGAMGFSDKLCNGVAIFTIQSFNPCITKDVNSDECTGYIRNAISYVPGLTACLSVIVLALHYRLKVSQKSGPSANYRALVDSEHT